MKDDFIPINRYPNKSIHLRNIEMAIESCNGKTDAQVAKLYNLSVSRAMFLCREVKAKMYERYFKVPFSHAFYTKECYTHQDLKELVNKYRQEYINWMVGNE